MKNQNTKRLRAIIALANHKGGVGKTTSTFNIAGEIAGLGYRVLVIDFDPQTNVSQTLGKESPFDVPFTANDWLTQDGIMPSELIHESNLENVDLVYAHLDMAYTETVLREQHERPSEILVERLEKLPDDYDYILIDTPPNLGLLTKNALSAATRVIIPVEGGSDYAARGLDALLNQIQRLSRYNKKLEVLGVLMVKHRAGKMMHDVVYQQVASVIDKIIPIAIPTDESVLKCAVLKKTARSINGKSPVGLAYEKVAKHIVELTPVEK